MSAEGRSRAYAGGRAVPVSLLTYLADDLVAVHGQADQQQLLRPGRQRQALDRFAGPELAAVLADYQRAYQRHRDVAGRAGRADRRGRGSGRPRRRTCAAAWTRSSGRSPAEGEDAALLAEEERLGARRRPARGRDHRARGAAG